jgi:hypothetical protein
MISQATGLLDLKMHMAKFILMLLSGLFATLHELVILMQHWSVKFNVNLNYGGVESDLMNILEEMSVRIYRSSVGLGVIQL